MGLSDRPRQFAETLLNVATNSLKNIGRHRALLWYWSIQRMAIMACPAMEAGATWRNAPKVVHTIEALENSVILQVSTPELHAVVRIQDRYGRPVEVPPSTAD